MVIDMKSNERKVSRIIQNYSVPIIILTVFLFTFCFAMDGYTQDNNSSAKKDRTLTVNAVNTDRIIIETKPTEQKPVETKAQTQISNGGQAETTTLFSWENIKQRWQKFRQTHDSYFRGFTMYTMALLLFGIIITLVLARVTRWLVEEFIVIRFATKTRTDLDDLFFRAIGRPISWIIISGGIYFSTLPILISSPTNTDNKLIARLCLALAASSIAWGLYRLVTVINHLLTKLAEKTDNNIDDLIVEIIRKSLKVTIVIFSVMFIGQNILGLNITTLLAGAGVFGLAVAFAARDTISNFFGTVMIIIDKPFTVGDRINSSGIDGIVEHVGFRSTRLRTLEGHLVTVPNRSLADNTITNISARPYIKHIFDLTLIYDTSPEQLERAIEILHQLLDGQECMDMEERAPLISFNSFNDWALNIKVIIWFFPADYTKFMLWLSETNLEILKRFNAEGLEFAFPTNTTYLELPAGAETIDGRVKPE